MARPFLPGSPGHVLYNAAVAVVLTAGVPLWLPWLLLSRKRRVNFPERLGVRGMPIPRPRDDRPAIWVHAVSVGETLASVPLLREIRRVVPDARIALSNVTLTGRETAGKPLADVVEQRFYFPFDLPGLCGKFLDRLRPDAVVIVETEIWPNFLAECARRGVPVVIVNGRLSERSFRGYLRLRRFFAPVLRTIRTISAQSREDADRFIALGAPPGTVEVGGNLKFDVSPPRESASSLSVLLQAERSSGTTWIVAGSTHEGEEASVLRSYLSAREANPGLKLLLAPRHPERFEAVFVLARQAGVRIARRTGIAEGERALDAQVLLLDTVGELSSAYAAAGLAFVGGSLVTKGGHNVLEPAWHGVPTVVGPHMENFREIAGAFLSAGALIQVADEDEFTAAVVRFASDPSSFAGVGRKGRELLESFRGATERNAAAVLSAIGRGGRA